MLWWLILNYTNSYQIIPNNIKILFFSEGGNDLISNDIKIIYELI